MSDKFDVPALPVTRRRFVLSSVAASLAGVPNLAAAQGQTTATRGGNLNVGYPADPRIYNGYIYENAPQYVIMHNVMSKLLWWDTQGRLEGDLAESWTQSPDQKEFIFKLRQGVKWHDGQPFTAEDVVWSFETVRKGTLSFAKFLAPLTELRALDSHTVKMTFSKSTPITIFAYYSGSNVILPKHLFQGTDLQSNPYNLKMVGTGPFMWKQYVRDQSLVLERNPHFHGLAPYLDTVTLRFTPNPATAILQLRSGALDMISNQRNLGVNDLVSLSTDQRFQVVRLNSTIVMRMSFNFRPEAVAKHKWLADVRVRRAIAHAIDRETLCGKLLHGFLETSWGPFARAHQMYDSNIKPPTYDPARAEALLDEAGFKRGPDGVRFACDFAYVPYFGTDAVAPAVADMLRRVGIRLNLLTADYPAFLSKYWLGPEGQGETPLTLIIGITAPTGDDCRPNYDSRNQPRNNGNGLSIPQVDRLFDEGLAESDPAKQKAIYSQLQTILSDEVVNVWIGTFTSPNVATRKVQNLRSLGYWDVIQRLNEVWLSA